MANLKILIRKNLCWNRKIAEQKKKKKTSSLESSVEMEDD